MANLKGKVAWVTGAGTGIGEGAALALARDGATVVLTGRRTEALQAVVRQAGRNGATTAEPTRTRTCNSQEPTAKTPRTIRHPP